MPGICPGKGIEFARLLRAALPKSVSAPRVAAENFKN
jgi:hypothetical protein